MSQPDVNSAISPILDQAVTEIDGGPCGLRSTVGPELPPEIWSQLERRATHEDADPVGAGVGANDGDQLAQRAQVQHVRH